MADKTMNDKIQSIYNLTPLQEGMLFHKQLDEGSSSYVMQDVIRFKEKINLDTIKKSFQLLSIKYDVLRTIIFYRKVKNPKQVVLKERELEFKEIDISDIPIDQQDKEVNRIKSKDVERGFDLEKDTLLRITAIVLSEKETVMLWSFHHIILDGWSIPILFGDFMKIYAQLESGMGRSELEKTVLLERQAMTSFGDYIKWIESQDKEKGIAYWGDLLKDYEDIAEIKPIGKIEEIPQKTINISRNLNQELSNKIQELSKVNNITTNTVLEAAWGILLQKYNRTKDSVFGKVVSGRNADIPGIESAVGIFINTVPIRVNCEKEITCKELLKSIQEQGIDSTNFGYCSLSEIQSQTILGYNLIKTLLVFENYFIDTGNNSGNVEDEETNTEAPICIDEVVEETNYDITLSILVADTLNMKIMYNKEKYCEDEIHRILIHMEKILEEMVKHIDHSVHEINVISDEERQLIGKFNATDSEYDKNKTIVDLFEDQVERTPEKVAVVFEDQALTYQELNNKSNQLARLLREKGVKPNDFVGILINRSIEMIIALYGTLKAGAAYVPIDPNYPENRINHIINDSNLKVLLTGGEDRIKSFKIKMPIVNLYDVATFKGEYGNLDKVNTSADLLYLIYTSGTTGNAKAVMMHHQSIVNLLLWEKNHTSIDLSSKVSWATTICFDVSAQEIMSTLSFGGTGYLADEDTKKDTNLFVEFIEKNRINVVFATPSYFDILTSNKYDIKRMFESITDIILAGEAFYLNDGVIKEIDARGIRVHNHYGPSETHVVTFSDNESSRIINNTLTIGRPIFNTKTYILDGNKEVGVGIPGELCITGDCVARGYLNRPELTETKFIDNPFGGGKMYRTGDLARWLPNGYIEYLGRIDEQVKIRGFRIELGEVEAAIGKLEMVKDVVVIAVEDNTKDKKLCAYVVSDTKLKIDEIKASIAKDLPEYMIPAHIMQIDSIPVTSNGKVNKRVLPKVDMSSERVYIAPRNETQQQLVDLYEEILGIEKVGIRDDFFALGGHSLRATRLMNRIEAVIGVRLRLKLIFSNPTIEKLDKLINGETENHYEPIPKAEIKEYYPMSSAQKRLYALNEIDDVGIAYNMPQVVEVRGKIDVSKYKDAFQKLVERHESLRTSFHMVNGEPVQKVAEDVTFELEYEENDSKSPEEIVAEFVRPFDLSKAPLMRMKLAKIQEDQYIMMFDMHHIISDGETVNIITREFGKFYNGETLEPLRVHYKDYSEWMRGRNIQDQKQYWLEAFSDELPVLDLPLDYKRPAVQSFRGNVISKNIEVDLKTKIDTIAKKMGATEYMVLLSTFMVLLSKYSRQEDMIIGTPIAGRTHQDTENMVGMFVNTLAMRGKPEGEKTVEQFISEIKETCLKAYENQEYPFEELVEEINIKRDLSRNPIFDIMFVFQNNETASQASTELEASGIQNNQIVAKFDMTVNINEYGGKYIVNFEYCKDLFKEESIERMVDHFVLVLEDCINNLNKKIKDIEVISVKEKELILNQFNNTTTAYPKDKTIAELLEEQVNKAPDNIAAIFGEEKISYRELNIRANKLARRLREEGVKPNDFVAIMAEKSIETIIGIYGIIKAGAAYVPINLTYPKDRIEYMLKDSGAKVLLRGNVDVAYEINLSIFDLYDDNVYVGDGLNLQIVNQSKDLAYLIYTSGTTGNPKGVMVEHRNVVRLVKNTNYVDFTGVKVLQTGDIAFDASTFEIWGALLNGGELYLADNSILSSVDILKREIVNKEINTLWLTAALFNQVITSDPTVFDTVTNLLIGGEKLSEAHVKLLKEVNTRTRLINGYGPTENTTFTTTYEIMGKDNINIPIGKPIANTQVYIMNSGHLCGVGVKGELCTSGDGIARGYLNSLELTEERFVENPFGEGKLYRTGDLARWLPDGNIEYLGRIDQQVKIRGFRIELGEIDSAIRKLEAVKDVATIVRNNSDGTKHISAYLVSDRELGMADIREELSKILPEYMIPAYMMQIDLIPTNKNGKVDRRLLPEIEVKREHEYVAPSTDIEKALVEVYEEVLGLDRIGVKDNFFELGGDSIKGIRVVSFMKERGYQLSVKDLINGRTVETIARMMTSTTVEEVDNVTRIYRWNTDVHESFDYDQSNVYSQLMKYDDNILGGSILNEYEPLSLQKSFLHNKNNICNLIVDISGGFDESDILTVIQKLIKENDVLRTVANEKENKFYQYDMALDWYIPFIDASEDEEFRNKVIDECEILMANAKNYLEGKLLSKVFVVKMSSSIFRVYFYIQHAIWDEISNEALFKKIKTYLNNPKKRIEEKYTFFDYGLQQNMIKSNTSIEELLKDEFLQRFVSALGVFGEAMDVYLPRTIGTFEVTLSEEVNKKSLEDPLILGIEMLKQCIYGEAQLKDITEIPYILLYHGRDKDNGESLGMYLDWVPGIATIGKDGNIEKIETAPLKKDSLIYSEICNDIPFINLAPSINCGNIFNREQEENESKVVDNDINIMELKDNIGFVVKYWKEGSNIRAQISAVQENIGCIIENLIKTLEE